MTAAERILGKALAASTLDSSQWSAVHAALRDRAFFSARVDDARRLAVMREAAARVASGNLSESEARLAIREALDRTGYATPEGREGGLTDLRSKRRLDLILQTNAAEAHGYMRFLEGTSEGALAAFPCQELIRVEGRKAPRNWTARWKNAGGQLYGGGRMIALKTSPIWTAISRFGHPWPPFDFGSGMGVRDVSRSEAIRYGVITQNTPPQKPPAAPRFNDGLSAPLPDKKTARYVEDVLRASFGSQVSIHDGEVRFNADLISEMLEGRGEVNARLGKGGWNPQLLEKIADPATRERVKSSGLTITRDWLREHGQKHRNPTGKGNRNLPLTAGDYELIPSLWHRPDSVAESSTGRLDLALDTIDGGRLFLGIDIAKGQALTFQKRRIRS